ncbi:hypothetical protein B0T17DRAFT_614812 [Bombardia bombarda]|uniref:Molybdate-anion transporter n=1 Tax=Bombardia bombarda TaxID=252184 RepID=A0AA39X7X5_9PEZI|nr:hypothetical protein B0T17DRAFT_614812 [Bombardia bombarda]
MATIYTLNLASLLTLCGGLFLAQSKTQSHVAATNNSTTQKSSSSKAPFLTVYALVMASDWLQGPFLYSLYRVEHNLPHSLVSALFTTGFLSGAVSGSFVGSVADRRGRKAGCLFFCAAYSLSCLSTIMPSSSVPLLFVGRALGGLATSLLFSVFESWMVADFGARYQGIDGGEGREVELSKMFGLMSTVNSVVAIASGVGSEWLVAVAGTRKAPFAASVVLLAVAFGVIWTQWAEYYGEAETKADSAETEKTTVHKTRLWTILANPSVLSLGLTSTVFEGSMYLFVFFWTPALRSAAATTKTDDLPLGVIFASFMASCLASSLAFNIITTGKLISHATLLLCILATSSVCLFLSARPSSEQSAFWVFCLFEAAVGMYWPCMGCLKGALIDDGIRSQVYGMLRVPLNVFVVVSLLLTGEAGDDAYGTVFTVCASLLLAACGALWVGRAGRAAS